MLVHLKWHSFIFSFAVFLRLFKPLFTDKRNQGSTSLLLLDSERQPPVLMAAFSASWSLCPALTPLECSDRMSLCVCLLCPGGKLLALALALGPDTSWMSVGPALALQPGVMLFCTIRPVPLGPKTSRLDRISAGLRVLCADLPAIPGASQLPVKTSDLYFFHFFPSEMGMSILSLSSCILEGDSLFH